MSHVKVTIEVKDANGVDAIHTVQRPILMGHLIPERIEEVAKNAAADIWNEKLRLRKREAEVTSVQFSDAASVFHPDGSVFEPFTQNSYTALVTFSDGARVVLTLPVNARSRGRRHWQDSVESRARLLRTQDLRHEITARLIP